MVGYDIHDPSKVWVRALDERLVAVAGLDANKQPYFPKSEREQAREERGRGRLKRLDIRRSSVLEEFDGKPPEIDYDAGWTPEQQARLEALAARQNDREPPRRREDEDKDMWYARARQLDATKAAGGYVSEKDLAWLEDAHARAWYQSKRRLDQLREKSA
jgi:putative transposase